MLIFHQEDFRQILRQLYDSPGDNLAETYQNPGFISTFLVVIAIALQYTGKRRQQLLEGHGIESDSLKEKILLVIRSNILDIAALGSLEAVQTCILLGSYYLYHGNPELAWPVCGCGLRVAQALNLHRKLPHLGNPSSETEQYYETRKRCWWAIYEIETFCSMTYGYPHSIKDSDYDVELLEPLIRINHGQPSPDVAQKYTASLLSYKYLMSKLSILIKDILTDLYGLGSSKGGLQQRSKDPSGLQNLIRKVSALDIRLQQWNAEIPDQLRLNSDRISAVSYTSVDDMDSDIGASGLKFENHVYQLQALEACRDAALRTSEIEKTSVFSLAADTYAQAFIGCHTFTAGVMLCMLSSTEPLSEHSYQLKTGLRRLSMQAHLKSRSDSKLAAQGLDILERLARLIIEKELKEMLPASNERSSQLHVSDAERGLAICNMDEGAFQAQALSLNETPSQETIFNYIEDPAISQALHDFDQVLSGQDINSQLEAPLPDFDTDIAPELAWIWGVDSLTQF